MAGQRAVYREVGGARGWMLFHYLQVRTEVSCADVRAAFPPSIAGPRRARSCWAVFFQLPMAAPSKSV
jgi:hypothetical protein